MSLSAATATIVERQRLEAQEDEDLEQLEDGSWLAENVRASRGLWDARLDDLLRRIHRSTNGRRKESPDE